MNTRNNLGFARFAQSILIVLLVSILIFVSTGTHVQGQIGEEDSLLAQDETGTEGSIAGGSIVPGGPGFIMVSPMDFKGLTSSDEWWCDGSGGIYNPSGTSPTRLVAGLTLPHNATLTKLVLYYKDNYLFENIIIYLYRGDFEGNISKMASLHTSGEETAYRILSTTEIADPVVDNQNYSYYLFVWFPGATMGSMILANVRIDYAYTSNLPAVMKNQ